MSEPARRLEIFTGAGRRRRWSAEQKAEIVAESVGGSESVSAVARRLAAKNVDGAFDAAVSNVSQGFGLTG
jgi:hypothetical protein